MRHEHGRLRHRRGITVLNLVLLILAVSFGAPWITIVALKLIAEDMGGLRSIAASANSLAWLTATSTASRNTSSQAFSPSRAPRPEWSPSYR